MKNFATNILGWYTRTKRYAKLVLFLVVLSVVCGTIRLTQEHFDVRNSVVLKADEKDAVRMVGRQLIVVRRLKNNVTETKVMYVPPDGGTKVVIKKDGKVDVRIKNKGMAYSPAFGFYHADIFRPTLDVNILYWNRFGVNVGVGFGKHPTLVPFIAVNYGWGTTMFQNTSFMLGVDLYKRFLVGIRVRF